MSFFLNEEQEAALNQFLIRENTKVCEKQINEDTIPKEFREMIEKTLEINEPIPFFDPLAGYYSVSFTPCERGDRIYAHHHITGESVAIYDPSLVVVNNIPDEETTSSGIVEDEVVSSGENVLDQVDLSNGNSEGKDFLRGISEEDGIYFPTGS